VLNKLVSILAATITPGCTNKKLLSSHLPNHTHNGDGQERQ
jgi:hypothetical protein